MSAAIVHTAVLLAATTDYAPMPEFGQVWVGTTRSGASNLCIQGDAAALLRLAQALDNCAKRMVIAQQAGAA